MERKFGVLGSTNFLSRSIKLALWRKPEDVARDKRAKEQSVGMDGVGLAERLTEVAVLL